MKKTLIVFIVSLLLISGVFAATENGKSKKVTLSKNAVEVSPGVYYLGERFDNGRFVKGYAFLLKDKKAAAKPGTECGNDICEPGENAKKCPQDCSGAPEDPIDPTSSCYTFLASGARWKSLEGYVVDPSNTAALDESFIVNNMAADISKWESASGYNILGNGVAGEVDVGSIGYTANGVNEVMFGDIEGTGIIGMAIVWGYFSGPKPWRELVEWDMVFNDFEFDWSSAGEAGKMDFENIATHELGHACGLGDLYTTECNAQTMYGYSSYGDIEKRTLESGDITGISSLY